MLKHEEVAGVIREEVFITDEGALQGEGDAALRILALMQPDDAMVEAGARALASHAWKMGGNDVHEEAFVERRWPFYVEPARACLTAAFASERAAIVAWMRQAPNPWGSGPANWLATAIEQGQHMEAEMDRPKDP